MQEAGNSLRREVQREDIVLPETRARREARTTEGRLVGADVRKDITASDTA